MSMRSDSRVLFVIPALFIAAVLSLLVGASPVDRRGDHGSSVTSSRRIQDIQIEQPAAAQNIESSAAAKLPTPISLSDADGQELILEDLNARAAIHGMLSL